MTILLENFHARKAAIPLRRDADFPVRLPGADAGAQNHDAAGADHELRVRWGHFAGPGRHEKPHAAMAFLDRAYLRAWAIYDPLHQRSRVVDGAFDV